MNKYINVWLLLITYITTQKNGLCLCYSEQPMDQRIRPDGNPTLWIKSRSVTRLGLGYHIGYVPVTPLQFWLWLAIVTDDWNLSALEIRHRCCVLRRHCTSTWVLYRMHISASITPKGFNKTDVSSSLFSIIILYVWGRCFT